MDMEDLFEDLEDLVAIVAGFAAGAVICWAIWSVLNWVWFRPKRLERHLRKQGFSGNTYRLLFGDVKEMLNSIQKAESSPIGIDDDIIPRVLPFAHHYVSTYGKNSFMWLGPTPRVNIFDPELVKEVLTKINVYQKPSANPLALLLAPGLAHYEGDQWVKHRKLLTPAFHTEKLKSMLPAFHLSCSEMVTKWEKMISLEGSSELDVWPDLQKMTSDVISRTAFGSNYEEGRKVFELQTEQASLTMQEFQSVYIPGSRFIPTKRNKRIKQVDSEICSALRSLINRRMNEMKAGTSGKTDDLLGILLEANLREIEDNGNNKKAGMSIDEVIGECKTFYFAGQETTAILLVWTMVLLSRHQNWQQQAREEVLEVFGNQEPTTDGLNHLKIVTMILHEVLRFSPPVAILTRVVHKDTQLGKLLIPAGVMIALPIIQLQHDTEIWGDDAKEFKPERFSEGIAKAVKKQVSYFPFSWGPRVCIGQNFTMLEAKMALALILKRFSFELSPLYAHAPCNVLTIRPQHGAHLILHKLQA